MHNTVIVVPCYNEEKRLNRGAFLESASKSEGLHFIFVDDGSSDGTAAIIEEMRRADPARISCLHLERNSGKAEAVRRGVLKAIADGCRSFGYWDADLATPLEEITVFRRLLEDERWKVVIGSRVKLLGKEITRNEMRHYAGRVFATIASLLLRIPVYDTQCGAKLFRNTPEARGAFSKPFKVKWIFDVELLARISLLEKKNDNPDFIKGWIESPLGKWTDIKGSKVTWFDFFKSAFEMLKLFVLLYAPVIKERYENELLQAR